MGNRKLLKGQENFSIKVLKDLPLIKNTRTRILVKCNCGKIKTIDAAEFSRTKSCGCRSYKESPISQKFGRLTIISFHSKDHLKRSNHKYNCLCSCGKEVVIPISSLRGENTRSCGCLKRETTIKRLTIHGYRHHPLYATVKNQRHRCRNTKDVNWHLYGGRGIEWRFKSIPQAIRHIEKKLEPKPSPEHTIDRIDNDGHYKPGNLRWATKLEQRLNQRERRPNKGKPHKGIRYDKRSEKWVARYYEDKKAKHIGYFKTEKEAIKARTKFLIQRKKLCLIN